MRIRSVKPEFWSHEMHAEISETAALLALALLNYADDEGRFKVQLPALKSLLFTFREPNVPIEQAFEELVKIGYLTEYASESEGRKIRLACVTNFGRHQCINRKQKSSLPAPPKRSQKGSSAETDNGTFTEDSLNNHGTLTDDAREQDGTLTEGSWGKEGRKGKEGGSTRAQGASTFESFAEIPTAEEVRVWAEMSAVDPEYAEEKRAETTEKHGWEMNGRLINWQARFRRFWESDKAVWLARKKRRAEQSAPGVSAKNEAEIARLEAELDAEQNPEIRREIRKKIREAGGMA